MSSFQWKAMNFIGAIVVAAFILPMPWIEPDRRPREHR
jgi:hypothetical protein